MEEIFSGTFVENPSYTRLFSVVGGAMPSLMNGMAITKVTKSPKFAYALLAGAESGDLYEEAKASGMDTKQATRLYGTSVAGTVGVDMIAKPIEHILDVRVKGTAGRVRKALVDGTREGTTETFQQVWQNMVRKYGLDDTQELTDGLVESFIGGLVLLVL